LRLHKAANADEFGRLRFDYRQGISIGRFAFFQ